MSVLHAFPPGVRQALDAMRGDPADELQELAQKLGGSDAETAKRWREILKCVYEQAWLGARRIAVYEESEVLHFLEEVRLARLAAAADARPAIDKTMLMLARLVSTLREVKSAGLEATVRFSDDARDVLPIKIKRLSQAKGNPRFVAQCFPRGIDATDPAVTVQFAELIEAVRETLADARTDIAPVSHGQTECARRFMLALSESLLSLYGDGNKWALIAWVCDCLGYRNPRGMKYTAKEVERIVRDGG